VMNRIIFCFIISLGNLAGDGPVDLVLSCVDNFEARMTINAVSCKDSAYVLHTSSSIACQFTIY
jgi:hypothetical protein